MQGQRSSISTLPENLSFDHGSASDVPLDSQMSWSNIHTSAQNRLPDYRMPSTETSVQYLHHFRHDRQNANWSFGESSSSGAARNQANQNETKTEHQWNLRSRPSLTFNERHNEAFNVRSMDNIDVNSNDDHATAGSFIFQSSDAMMLPQDLNMSSGFGDHEDDGENDDDCQIVERPSSYSSTGSINLQRQFNGSNSTSFGVASGHVAEEREERLGHPLDGGRISCKRKALEMHVGQSSGSGSSNGSENLEGGQWHDLSPASCFTIPIETETELVVNNETDQADPRLRLGAGGSLSASPSSFTSSTESSRRNFRLRINGLYQQEVLPGNPFPVETDSGSMDLSSSRNSSRLVIRNRLFDLNPTIMENSGSQGPRVLHVPSVRRNPHSRWSGGSISRSGGSTSGERDPSLIEESSARNLPRTISEHPMFIPANESGSSSQHPTNWNLASGNNNTAGNIASFSQGMGSSSGVNSSAPNWSHRSCPQYPRRLSEIVRRSLLSAAGTESGGQSSNQVIHSSSAPSQETALPEGNLHHTPSSRLALLERHLDGAFGIPYSLRTWAAGEGRSSIMSEIRHVLDLMRRGEGLRFEDLMVLDHSVLFGMADIHDRHRDMRLDVDNMSYEELLALEERIGNVCTGLSEETIMTHLKRGKYVANKTGDKGETEPCSICREEYVDGEDLGRLECRHDFHRDCIKQWLMQKNLCPICKTTGLAT